MADFVVPGTLNTQGQFTPLSTTGGTLDVNGVFSATLAPFAPNGNGTILAAGTASGNVLLPAGTVVEVFNPGTVAATVKFGTSNAVTAGTADIQLAANSWLGFAVGSNTYMAGITAAGTATLTIAGGAGLPTGAGGGSASGGVSSTVTLAAGSAVVGHVINDAGSAIIGNVRIDQTTAGTTNGVVVNAGTNVMGHVIVDSGSVNASGTLHTISDSGTLTLVSALTGITNPVHTISDSGTLTLVSAVTTLGTITSALPTGTNILGRAGFDQTTPGTTNAITFQQSAVSGAGIAPVTTATTAEVGHVLKASAGNLHSIYCTNTGTVAGYLFVMNSTTVIADGTLTSGQVLDCIAVGTLSTNGLSYSPIPEFCSTGISVCLSSTAAPVKTAIAAGWFNGRVV